MVRHYTRSVLAYALALCGLATAISAQAQPLPLTFLVDVPLPGSSTRFDYESLDAKTGLLFIAHLGADSVVVFDTKTRRVVKEISGVPAVHGILAVPELARVYASATGTNEIVVIDSQTLSILARVPGGQYPDGIAYAPREHKLYISDETGRTDTVIDVRTNQRNTTIPLGSSVGNTQYSSRDHLIYVSLHDGNLAAIDPQTDRVVARYPLAGCVQPHGLLIDPGRPVAYIACADGARMVSFDLRLHHVRQAVDVGGNPDVLAFDSALQRLYVAGEDGIVSAFAAAGSRLAKIGEAPLARNAHVVAVDSRTHTVYFPLLDVAGKPVLRIMSEQP